MRLTQLEPVPTATPTADALRERWLGAVTQQTGIDFADWDPSKGTAHNRATIRTSYRYYATRFLDHPELQWAGMANTIAPTFAAAFDDLAVVNRHLADWSKAVSRIPGPVRDALHGAVDLANLPVRQMAFVERTFLSMQREIFTDQAIMHEAYLGGGMPAISELRTAGVIDAFAEAAWQQIDEGRRTADEALVEAGNHDLLQREQLEIVADDYDAMRTYSRSSPLLTYLLTCLGRPAVPGSHTPGQVDPIDLGGVRLPLPAFDVSRREDRWRMTETDTLPAYQKLLHTQPDALRALVASDLDGRIAAGHLRLLPDHPSVQDLVRLFAGFKPFLAAQEAAAAQSA